MRRLLLFGLLLLTACGEGELRSLSGVYLDRVDSLATLQFQTTDEKGRSQKTSLRLSTLEVSAPAALIPGAPVTLYYQGNSLEGSDSPIRVEVDESYACLVGRWLERDEPELDMGLELLPKGLARSIGMQTIAFEKWEYLPEGIRLSGATIGGGNSVPFSEMWVVEELTDSLLTLSQPDLTLRFRRESDADIRAREERAEAARQAAEEARKNKAKKRR